jgi:hypothetical protein
VYFLLTVKKTAFNLLIHSSNYIEMSMNSCYSSNAGCWFRVVQWISRPGDQERYCGEPTGKAQGAGPEASIYVPTQQAARRYALEAMQDPMRCQGGGAFLLKLTKTADAVTWIGSCPHGSVNMWNRGCLGGGLSRSLVQYGSSNDLLGASGLILKPVGKN